MVQLLKTDYNVFRNNYIYQTVACGFVVEFVDNEWQSGACATGDLIEGNVVECVGTGFCIIDNIFDMDTDELVGALVFFQDITIRDNYVMYTNFEWCGDPKFWYPSNNLQPGEPVAFTILGNPSRVKDMTVSNNVFYLTNGGSLIQLNLGGDTSGITFSGNTYVQSDNQKIIFGDVLRNRLTVDEIKEGIAAYIGDTTAKAFAPSVLPLAVAGTH